MLWGRVTYEMMESYWPAVARGDAEAPAAMRAWAAQHATARTCFGDAAPQRRGRHALPARALMLKKSSSGTPLRHGHLADCVGGVCGLARCSGALRCFLSFC